MGIFAGDRPLIVGVLTAIGVEQGVLYCRYRHQVREANTSMAGSDSGSTRYASNRG